METRKCHANADAYTDANADNGTRTKINMSPSPSVGEHSSVMNALPCCLYSGDLEHQISTCHAFLIRNHVLESDPVILCDIMIRKSFLKTCLVLAFVVQEIYFIFQPSPQLR